MSRDVPQDHKNGKIFTGAVTLDRRCRAKSSGLPPLDPGPNQLLTSNLKLSNLPETLTETKIEPLDIELRDIYDFIYNYSKLRKI